MREKEKESVCMYVDLGLYATDCEWQNAFYR